MRVLLPDKVGRRFEQIRVAFEKVSPAQHVLNRRLDAEVAKRGARALASAQGFGASRWNRGVLSGFSGSSRAGSGSGGG